MGRRGYVAAALAVMVLLVVPLALGSLHTRAEQKRPAQADEPMRPSLVDAGDPKAAAALTCDGEVAAPESLPLAGSLQAARLCATHGKYRRWTAPEPLFDDLDTLAAGIARLEPAPEDYMCFQSGGSYHYDLRLVVDGEVVSLETQPRCLEFTVAGVDYVNTDEPFDAYLTALTEQRDRRDPPPLRPTSALDCTAAPLGKDHALSPLGHPLDMVEAVSCWRPDSNPDVGPWRGGAAVPPDQMEVLMDDIAQHTRRDLGFDNGACGDDPLYWQDLLGRTSWGDVVVIRGVCSTFLLDDPNSTAPEDQKFWYPSPPAQRILDGLRR